MAEPDLLKRGAARAAWALPAGFRPTPPGWLPVVLADFDSFLRDHASCEKKASGMALNVASHYPDRPRLLAAMADLAVEELTHYRDVLRLMAERGTAPGADVRDPYVRQVNALIRKGPDRYLLDRLLVGAVVEARGFERFGLIAAALDPGPEQRFFRAICASEGRHWHQFVELARLECPGQGADRRLEELIDAEGAIMAAQPFRAALH